MQLSEDDFAALEAMNQDIYAKMRESEFVKRLLPHLIPDENQTEKRPVDIYVEAVGHANRMIQVVDDNNPNKVLYVVPPLLPQTPTVIVSESSVPTASIRVMAEEFENAITTNHPGYVIDTYVRKLVELNYAPADAMTALYSRMWASIYLRYNIPLERLFGEHAEEIRKEFAAAAPAEEKKREIGQDFNDFDDDDFETM